MSDVKHNSASPPFLAISVVVTTFAISIATLPSFQSLDEASTVEIITSNGNIVSSIEMLAAVRLTFAAFIFSVTMNQIACSKIEIETQYLPKTKLLKSTIKLCGIQAQAFFTKWSWNLLGLSFLLNGLIPLLVSSSDTAHIILTNNPWISRLAILTFETAAPSAMLVSSVVKYAIWPNCLRNQKTENLKKMDALLQHNANVIMVIIEVCLLGNLSVRLGHFSFALLFGIAYVLFAWSMRHLWVPHRGPQFLYFFLDTTLGNTTTIALLGLLLVMLTFHFMFWGIGEMIEVIGSESVGLRGMLAVGLLSLVCRFRD